MGLGGCVEQMVDGEGDGDAPACRGKRGRKGQEAVHAQPSTTAQMACKK